MALNLRSGRYEKHPAPQANNPGSRQKPDTTRPNPPRTEQETPPRADCGTNLNEQVHEELARGLIDLEGVAGDVDEFGVGKEFMEKLEPGGVGGGLGGMGKSNR